MARKKSEISIFRIAEEAGVSISTVSRVMNNRTGVNEKTRSKIQKLLQQYDFTPDYPRMRAAKITFLCPQDDLTEYFRKAFRGITRYARKHEIEVGITIRSGQQKGTLLEQIRDQQASGVIVALAENFHGEQLELGSLGIPVIFLDAPLAIPNTGFIDHDAYSGSSAATRHLIELGHRNIGYLTFHEGSINQIHRFKGYENTMKSSNLHIKPNWIARTPARPPNSAPYSKGVAGFELMNRLLDEAPELTAVLAVDDNMAYGAMTAIHRHGLNIPKDISIVGFDNNAGTDLLFTALTTVMHPLEEAGFQAAAAIDKAIQNPGNWNLPRDILSTELIIRDSTDEPRAKA